MIFNLKQNNDLSEAAMRPPALYKEWKNILKKEVGELWQITANLQKIDCPGCDSKNNQEIFTVFGVRYKKCEDCGTVFAATRPTRDNLRDFYHHSLAVKFWKEKIIPASQEKRQQYSHNPLLRWFLDIVRAHQVNKESVVVDYQPKFNSIFLSRQDLDFTNINLVDPLYVNNDDQAIKTCDKLDKIIDQVSVFTAFNVLDKEANPDEFLREVSDKCQKGGLFFLTANTISGLEYQVLGGQASRLVPPDRLNLLSVEAVEYLLAKNNFTVLDISTPGKLDLDIIINEYKENPDIILPEFIKYIIKHRDKSVCRSLQSFLQLNNLSSFLRAVAIKN